MVYHTPALLQQVITALSPQKGKKYIDATLGGGGHTRSILDNGGLVLGIDQDKDALDFVNENFKFEILNLKLKTVWGNFKDIKKLAKENGFEKVSGILFDLGVSSHQLDSPERGFSFKFDTKLDMRMGKGQLTAYDVVNTYSQEELETILLKYGEEDQARKITQEIMDTRHKKKIETTKELKELIESTIYRNGAIHPATKTFQAIRIEVNNEMDRLKQGLSSAIELLDENGSVAVISFHSLEDRIVKRTFEMWGTKRIGKALSRKPITAAENELLSNPRARSAKLRVFQKEQ